MANNINRYEHDIPEGYEARIEGNKVIIEKIETEDEKTKREILEFFDHAASGKGGCIDGKKFWDWYCWLEKKNPCVWNKDDVKMLNRVISYLERIGANSRTDSTSVNYCYPEEREWLKSLRNRIIWAPTKEQIKALDNIASNYYPKTKGDSETIERINTLRTELEKLL